MKLLECFWMMVWQQKLINSNEPYWLVPPILFKDYLYHNPANGKNLPIFFWELYCAEFATCQKYDHWWCGGAAFSVEKGTNDYSTKLWIFNPKPEILKFGWKPFVDGYSMVTVPFTNHSGNAVRLSKSMLYTDVSSAPRCLGGRGNASRIHMAGIQNATYSLC